MNCYKREKCSKLNLGEHIGKDDEVMVSLDEEDLASALRDRVEQIRSRQNNSTPLRQEVYRTLFQWTLALSILT